MYHTGGVNTDLPLRISLQPAPRHPSVSPMFTAGQIATRSADAVHWNGTPRGRDMPEFLFLELKVTLMTAFEPVVTGIVGLGGYAQAILRALRNSTAETPPSVKLAAATSIDMQNFAELIEEIKGEGVTMYDSFDALLASNVEAVWLPLPIHLHRPFTIRALEAGKAVMVEKPVAGCVDDVDAMIEARDRTGRPVAIGYQDVYDPTTLPFKRMLLDGVLGQITDVTLHATWPRDSLYYGRNNWAGAFKRNDVWVMDSPANNALAHYVNIALFLLGDTLDTAATPTAVEAELYRVNDIENYDTIAMRMTLPGGIRFLVLLTHAAKEVHNPTIRFEGEKGEAVRTNESVVIRTDSGEQTLPRGGKPMSPMVRRFSKLVRGIADDQIGLPTLESARAPLVAINGASEATVIHDVPTSFVDVTDTERGGKLRSLPGIEAAFVQCATNKLMLHESGLLPWTQPAGTKDLTGYRKFAGPKQAAAVAH